MMSWKDNFVDRFFYQQRFLMDNLGCVVPGGNICGPPDPQTGLCKHYINCENVKAYFNISNELFETFFDSADLYKDPLGYPGLYIDNQQLLGVFFLLVNVYCDGGRVAYIETPQGCESEK
jgi:hypothetical protein